ncbi:MAG: hypothetical protein JST90_15925 [Bacteroidetes bacterium]|nr:hypothetical protein [Bacteroidota bacterium]
MKKSLIYLVLACLTLTSCKHKLTRDEAAQILKTQDYSSYRQYDYIRKAFLISDRGFANGQSGGIRNIHSLPKAVESKINSAVAKGLMSTAEQVVPQHDDWYNASLVTGEQTFRYFNFTPEGLKYYAGQSGDDNKVVLYDREFGEITNLKEENENTVIVDYTLVVTKPTPFAFIWGTNLNQLLSTHARFIKTDKGWQLQ